jgi:microcystin-dependent protein
MPNEPIKGLITPNTGDLVGAWGTAAVNPNFTAIGAMLGGFTTISVSGATTVALSAATSALTPGAGPFQQSNAMIRFTGAQSGTATYLFSVPGFYIIDNQCTNTTFPIVLGPASGPGTFIGAPPFCKTQIFFDGTNVDYVNPPLPGSAIDLHYIGPVFGEYPAWMLAGSRPYALVKDGIVRNISDYPALGALLGSTFGGNGVTTFAVPDERSRMRLAVDTSGTNRVTSGGSGINGAQLGAAGGDQLLQSHAHSGSGNVSDPGHGHSINQASNIVAANNNFVEPATGTNLGANSGAINGNTTGITVPSLNINNTGGGGSQNMPPTIVSFLALIKT